MNHQSDGYRVFYSNGSGEMGLFSKPWNAFNVANILNYTREQAMEIAIQFKRENPDYDVELIPCDPLGLPSFPVVLDEIEVPE